MSPRISKAEVQIGDMPSKGTFPEILQAQISIAKTKVQRDVLKYLEEKLISPH